MAPAQESDTTPASAEILFSWPERWTSQAGVYQSRYPEDWERAWAITEGLIARTRDAAVRSGADFLLIGLPAPLAVLPSEMLERIEAAADVGGLDADVPTRRLTRIADAGAVEFLSLVSDFRSRIQGGIDPLDELFFACDGHFTARGHRLAADLLLEPIVKIAVE